MTGDGAKANEDAITKLHTACRAGKVTSVKKAISAGVDIESVCPTTGTTALGSAAMAGKVEVMRVLIEAGADIHGSNLDRPPLIVAAFGRWADSVRVLIDAGVDPNARSKNGATGIYPAIRNRSFEVASLLVERGAQIDDGDGALVVACVDSADHTVDREFFAKLMSLGARVDAQAPGGWTALIASARKGHEGDVRFLVARGADVTLKDSEGLTALDLARAKHASSGSYKHSKVIALLTTG